MANRGLWCVFLLLVFASPCPAQDVRLLWQEPQNIERVNFAYAKPGPASAPKPPFRFVEEDSSGNNPKVLVTDSTGAHWRIKGGLEGKAESFVTRIVAALGYYTEVTYFIPRGKIEGVSGLKRASGFVKPDGSFSDAGFELREPGLKYLKQSWAWDDNPFKGLRELQGLKLLMMLFSNWDNKDSSNWTLGSNTGIWERSRDGRTEWIYFVNDWGQTLGAWGKELRPKQWNCVTFQAQTPQFVNGMEGARPRFGFVGLHTDSFKGDINVDDVRWLMQYLGRISDKQIRTALAASGATGREVDCFTRALRQRIEQLRRVAAAR